MAKKKKSSFFLILLIVIFVYFIGIIVITNPKTTDAVNQSIQRKTATGDAAPTIVLTDNTELENTIKEYKSQIESLQATISSNQMVNDLRIATLEKTVAEPKQVTLDDVAPLLDEVVPVLADKVYKPVLDAILKDIVDTNDLHQEIVSWMIANRQGIITEVIDEILSSKEIADTVDNMIASQLESVDGSQIYAKLVQAEPKFDDLLNEKIDPELVLSNEEVQEVQEFIIDFIVSNQSYFADVISNLIYDSIIDDLRLLVDNDESLTDTKTTQTEVVPVVATPVVSTAPVASTVVDALASVLGKVPSVVEEVAKQPVVEEVVVQKSVEPVTEEVSQQPIETVEPQPVEEVAKQPIETVSEEVVPVVEEVFETAVQEMVIEPALDEAIETAVEAVVPEDIPVVEPVVEVVEPVVVNFVDIVAESFFDPSIGAIELTEQQYQERSSELREKALEEYFNSLN